MKKIAAILMILLTVQSSFAAHWYVRTTSPGTDTGADWNNSWDMTLFNASNLVHVAAGDTVWLAGGTHTTQMLPKMNGTAGSPTKVYRVRTADAVPAAAAGWDAGFDSQVIIAPANAVGIYIGTANQGHNTIFDGRISEGIKIIKDNGTAGSYPASIQIDNGASTTNVLFLNLDLVGPFDQTTPVLSGINNYHAGISLTPRTGNRVSHITFSNVWVHGGVNLVNLLGGWGGASTVEYITFDKCKFYNNVASSASFHANMFEIRDVGNITWKNCEMYSWLVEGIMPYGTPRGPLYVYGCTWRDNIGSVARCFEPFGSWEIQAYNNTFVNIGGVGVYSASGTSGAWTSASRAFNNIYWNSVMGSLLPTQNYEFRGPSGSIAGANSIANGSNPFVNTNTLDFHIISTVSATLPRNKGLALTNITGHVFDIDPDGDTREGSSNRDIGMDEFATAGPPVISSELTATGNNGVAFEYQIVASGAPTAYSASGLPTGLSVDTTTGLISGTPNIASPPDDFDVTIGAENGAGSDSETLVITIEAASAICTLSTESLSFGEVAEDLTYDSSIIVTNTGTSGTTLSGTASTSSPWSIVGTATYSLVSGASQTITVRFSPTSKGFYNGTVTFTGGGGATAAVSGDAFPVFGSLTFSATNGLYSSQYWDDSTNVLAHINDNSESSILSGGRAVFGIVMPSSGTITWAATVNATDSSHNSFFVNMNDEPEHPAHIWDIVSLTSGLESRNISWRGNGTFDDPEYDLNSWTLAGGTHKLIIRGRESGVMIQTITGTFTAGASASGYLSGNAAFSGKATFQ